jgi:hypothetical protein
MVVKGATEISTESGKEVTSTSINSSLGPSRILIKEPIALSHTYISWAAFTVEARLDFCRWRQTHNIISSSTESTCIPLQTIDEILKFMFYFNIIFIVIVIITAIIWVTSPASTKTWISRNGDCANDAVGTINTNIATLIWEPNMLYCSRTKTRRFDELSKSVWRTIRGILLVFQRRSR